MHTLVSAKFVYIKSALRLVGSLGKGLNPMVSADNIDDSLNATERLYIKPCASGPGSPPFSSLSVSFLCGVAHRTCRNGDRRKPVFHRGCQTGLYTPCNVQR